ncbi:PH domain-containing protein [Thermicanus aegyptius]|uniref:PH domain-containing protein n=1 Tax=Thermicanus aegyptius TaxID=94009 RepID=UPI0012EBAC32|nr:PH domain-containing protein [Thermicanus aegyptius]
MNVEWQDRARWLGLPILFTRYWMVDETLHRRKGFLWIKEDRIPLYRILDIQVRKTPLDRILGLGTIVLYATDVTDSEMMLKGIKKADKVASLIQNRVNEVRQRYNIHGREMYGAFSGEFERP